MTHDHILFSWTAPEYIQHQKSVHWYRIAAVVTLVTAIWAFISGNWSMALAVITFAIVYHYLHEYHPPKEIKIEITKMGIRVGEAFYPYSHIQSFWIIYQPGLRTLNLRMTQSFFYDICIHFNDQDPVAVRKQLVGEIPEWEGKTERIGDLILRLLKL